MAPEALSGEFGQKADIWSLGVLMFELMFRENPFEGEDKNYEFPMEDYKNSIEMNLINERINSKIGYMSLPFRDLLLKLLEKLPEKRITLEEIREHDFFKEMSWTDVEARLNPPPLRDIIEKHDYITFRDATNEEYIRKEVAKHRAFKDNYEIRLYEFRNSQ
jgi:serine/threonine protein kinase